MLMGEDKKLQCTVAQKTYEWIQNESVRLKLRGRAGRVIDHLVEEVEALRKKCAEINNDGHPVK